MLSIYEHGENDEELQDAAFGLLHIITYGINRQMFYQFFWCVFCHMFASTHGIQLTGSHASLECCAVQRLYTPQIIVQSWHSFLPSQSLCYKQGEAGQS